MTNRPLTLWILPLCLIAAAQGATSRLEFDVATIKPSPAGTHPDSNFPLGGDAYIPNGGLFAATGQSLASYIFFAYQIQGNQAQSLVPQLPSWVLRDRFDIEARAQGNPGKDEMRQMMRALLADRFEFKMHTELREVPVLALVLSKPGKLGPGLHRHPADAPCPTSVAPPSPGASPRAYLDAVAGGLPVLCNNVVGMPAATAGRLRSGARNVTMEFIANYLSGEGTFGRPVIDATGLTGTYDFAIEWAPQGTPPPGSNFKPDPLGTTFEEAIGDQLGLAMKSRKSPMEVIVVDHVEHPSKN
jgi:uncharacterized protein (TIGR03435 family)